MRSVLKTQQQGNLMVVDLTDKILVTTDIVKEYHPALRSGFSGYPANPRWSATKFYAWKMGRQWREALDHGDMVVRSHDSMLVSIAQQEEKVESEKKPSDFWSKLPFSWKPLLISS